MTPREFIAKWSAGGPSYNERPTWLVNAHAKLDAAVAAAYGWKDGATLTDDEILRRLLALNRKRSDLAVKP